MNGLKLRSRRFSEIGFESGSKDLQTKIANDSILFYASHNWSRIQSTSIVPTVLDSCVELNTCVSFSLRIIYGSKTMFWSAAKLGQIKSNTNISLNIAFYLKEI